MLDSLKGRIRKYVAIDASSQTGRRGFSEIREYLNPDTLPDFFRGAGLAIDGSVWIGTNLGKIFRFTRARNTFTPQGLIEIFWTRTGVYQ